VDALAAEDDQKHVPGRKSANLFQKFGAKCSTESVTSARANDYPPKYAMVERIGEVTQELPVAIITHVMSKKLSASNPRQPRPRSARFLPS
jgi:hypothetical protein